MAAKRAADYKSLWNEDKNQDILCGDDNWFFKHEIAALIAHIFTR